MLFTCSTFFNLLPLPFFFFFFFEREEEDDIYYDDAV